MIIVLNVIFGDVRSREVGVFETNASKEEFYVIFNEYKDEIFDSPYDFNFEEAKAIFTLKGFFLRKARIREVNIELSLNKPEEVFIDEDDVYESQS